MAQNQQQNPFANYANEQGNLMHQAYEKRDVKEYKILLADVVSRYNKLSVNDRAIFRGYISSEFYNLSCAYSLLDDKKNALDYLDSAVNKGYTNYAHLIEDSDLKNIHNEERFKKISDFMRSQYDYMYILKKSGVYNNNDPRKIPGFTYQLATDNNLVALKVKFNLDSVAGGGDDASKAINILHWVHNTIHHDGQHDSGNRNYNAVDIVNIATSKNIGVSCGELATVLNECYLAMGWKSRKVYCFPKDSLHTDYDSHVINVVYLSSKNKWVWMDPTNDAYVMDENGELLSIEEVRYRLINNKPLKINPDANWNHRSRVIKEEYLDNYMAKNLYLLYSPLKSEYDYETQAPNKEIVYVHLLPLDYFKQKPDKTERKYKDPNLSVIHYNTNNSQAFWQVTADR